MFVRLLQLQINLKTPQLVEHAQMSTTFRHLPGRTFRLLSCLGAPFASTLVSANSGGVLQDRDTAAAGLECAEKAVHAAQCELAGAEAGDGRDESNRSMQERLADLRNEQVR